MKIYFQDGLLSQIVKKEKYYTTRYILVLICSDNEKVEQTFSTLKKKEKKKKKNFLAAELKRRMVEAWPPSFVVQNNQHTNSVGHEPIRFHKNGHIQCISFMIDRKSMV